MSGRGKRPVNVYKHVRQQAPAREKRRTDKPNGADHNDDGSETGTNTHQTSYSRRRPTSLSWAMLTSDGAADMRSEPLLVLGNAMTSRMESV